MEIRSFFQPKGDDRRRYPRIKGDFEIDLFVPSRTQGDEMVRGRALNISRGGLKVSAAADLPVGARLTLVVYYEDSDSVCLAEVVWKKPTDGATLYGFEIKRWAYLDAPLERMLSRLPASPSHSASHPSTGNAAPGIFALKFA